MIEQQEQIIRIANQVGNGAHIFVPKEWINEKVLVIRIEKKTIKEEIISKITPYLDKIIAVLLFGSYARGEQDKDSDVDVLVIAKEKFKIEKTEHYDFIVLAEDTITSAIESNPMMMHSIFKEAKPLINESYLEKLKKIKINKKNFIPFINSTIKAIKSNEEILGLDKKTGKFASNSVIYSLILRLRGIFIIKQLTSNKNYTNRLFKEWIIKSCNLNYSDIYGVYRSIRDNKNIGDRILIGSEENLLNFLKEEIKKLEKQIKI